jgi:3-hydroxyacyl-CoA dehydrogenase
VIEDLGTKRALFEKLEAARSDGSVISTNTSGIPLRSIVEGFPGRLRRDVIVTHFFNPVKVMKLLEVVPGQDTTPDVVEAMARFGAQKLGKGVVHAKDTVNFIGNRIGCFWMLSGLHKARAARGQGLSMETIDALMSSPVGLPSTGLYGLIDLIGLDVMEFVGKNLAVNLPQDDVGRAFTAFPAEVQALFEAGHTPDPDAIRAARDRLRGRVAQALADPLAQTFADMDTPGPYSPEARDAGRRTLLIMVRRGDDPRFVALALGE